MITTIDILQSSG